MEKTQADYIITGLLFALAVMFPVIGIGFLIYQRRLGRHRGVSREEFIRVFEATEVAPEIPAAVYDYYKSQAISKKFSLAPDDNYEEVLSEGNEDIDDDAAFLMKKLGLKIPSDAESVQPDTRIRTLRDMVRWLDKLRQHQASVG